ncbi:anti-sigma factor family protein [Nocardioides marmorisolisilvae]|uniref:Anti-sigma factor n=1 Tax=Nocardioides marmorisolisilvae TaxID=1542737 RepID=A0A3N0DX10_9ACTN|nr:zf-HC2 domain-containing protein [Nocardioides marmorisolisilvae]RNL80152.1 anti-sigma factor [Nocardioides marmorisolisilvae]
MSCGFEHDDGAYVLGALSPEDRAAFERHLEDCDSCTRSVRELAGLPGLLARVPVETLDADHQPEPVPATLLPGLLFRVRRARRRRTWATVGLVAAAATAAGVVAGVTVDHSSNDTGSSVVATSQAQRFTPVGTVPISGWVSLTRVGWGTRLNLTCSYASADAYGATRPVSYSMFVTRTDGTTEQVASWKAQPGKTLKIEAATAAAPGDIASVSVRTAGGRAVLRLVND